MGERPTVNQLVLFGTALALLLATGLGVHQLTSNGPTEARLWLCLTWVAGGGVVLVGLRRRPAGTLPQRCWLRWVAAPTPAELAVALLWAGSYFVLGSNATYPSLNLGLAGWQHDVAFIVDELYYGFPALLLAWLALRMALLADATLGTVARGQRSCWLCACLLAVLVAVQWSCAGRA